MTRLTGRSQWARYFHSQRVQGKNEKHRWHSAGKAKSWQPAQAQKCMMPCSNRGARYLVAYHAILLPAHKPLLKVFLMQRHNMSLDQGAGSEAVVSIEVATITIRFVFGNFQFSQQTSACHAGLLVRKPEAWPWDSSSLCGLAQQARGRA